MNRHLRKTIWAGWMRLAAIASRSYMAGPELSDALRSAREFAAHGLGSTICYWNGPEDEPELVAENYLSTMNAMTREGLDSYLSLKAPALGYDETLITQIIDRARKSGIRVHFDALGPDSADRTFEQIERCAGKGQQIGCTLPGRWHRSLADADRVAGLGLSVRVVKGEWADPEYPDIDLGDGFLAVIDRLAGRAGNVGVATHDVPLAREAIRRLQAANTSCELELLFGLPLRESVEVARELEVPVRLYVPYGHAWVPYCLSQVRRRPRILWWLVKDALRRGSSRKPDNLAISGT